MTQTRLEVESRLADVGRAINERVTSLEGEVRLPRLLRVSGMLESAQETGPARKKLIRMAGIAVGGVVALSIVRRMMRRSRRNGTVRAWAADVADDADRLVASGLSVRDAVDHAARLNAEGVPAASDGAAGGLLAALLVPALRTGLTTLLRGAVESAFNGKFGSAGNE